MKKGDISLLFVIGIVALFVMAVMIYTIAHKFGGAGGFNDLAQLLPSFLQPKSVSAPESGLYGIDLHDGLKLKKYTGSKWVEIKPGTFKVNNRTYDYSIKSRLEGYYFNTPRFGEPTFQLSDGSRLKVISLSNVGLENKFMSYESGEVGKYDFSSNVYVLLQHQVKPGTPSVKDGMYFFDASGDFFSVPDSGNVVKISDALKLALLGEARFSIISWRDQILGGSPCESWLSIDYDNGRGSEKYKVNRIDYMLYIDLNEPAKGKENYQDGCFTNPVGYYADGSQLKISFDNIDGFNAVYWGTPGAGCLRQWYGETDLGYIALSREESGRLNIQGDAVNFKDGLVAITERLDELDAENVRAYSVLDDPDFVRPLVSFEGTFGYSSWIEKLNNELEDSRDKYVKVVPTGTEADTFYDKSLNEKPRVSIIGTGEITYTYPGVNALPNAHNVGAEIVWDPKGKEGAGWYHDNSLVAVRNNIDAGQKYSYEQYPYTLFSSDVYRKSFDAGLPLVIEGFGVPQYVENPKAQYVNVYPFLGVKIVSESGEVDISKEVNAHLVKNGPVPEDKGILTFARAQQVSLQEPIYSASRIVSYNYYSTFDNDYC